jgi:hypothetical protein
MYLSKFSCISQSRTAVYCQQFNWQPLLSILVGMGIGLEAWNSTFHIEQYFDLPFYLSRCMSRARQRQWSLSMSPLDICFICYVNYDTRKHWFICSLYTKAVSTRNVACIIFSLFLDNDCRTDCYYCHFISEMTIK